MSKAFAFETEIQTIEVQVSASGRHTFTVKGGVKPGPKRMMYGTTSFSGVLPSEIANPFIAGIEQIFEDNMRDVMQAQDAPLKRSKRRDQEDGET